METGEKKYATCTGTLLPKLESDSDEVYDMGKMKLMRFDIIKNLVSKKRHHIIEGIGRTELVCFKTGHKYRHVICCPNKFALICRGCNETIE